MKRSARLVLARETLAELGSDDLRDVAGGPGTHVTCYTGLTVCGICDVHILLPTSNCPTETCTT